MNPEDWTDVKAGAITLCPTCRLEMDLIQALGGSDVQYQVWGCGECLQIFEAAVYTPAALN